MAKYKKTIAIDFDGVIHWYREGWKDGEIYDKPFPQAIKSIKELMKDYNVFIFTARDVLQVHAWMVNNFVGYCPLILLNKVKFYSLIYFLDVSLILYINVLLDNI